MQNLLLKRDSLGNRLLAYLTKKVMVHTTQGIGELVYGTQDGYCGVRLLGETRIDEYPMDAIMR